VRVSLRSRIDSVGSKARMTWTLLAVTVLLVIATVATWKRVLFGPVMGIAIALAVVIWQVLIGQTAVAVILAVPLVGGSWTAARGIVALKRLGGLNPLIGSHSD
jgi:hypothetical protein